ncbi:MAG: amidase family protein, partial [Oscillospiraceae bacterium]|nr:amidase family protein [Oscillospiraceae bacterium]
QIAGHDEKDGAMIPDKQYSYAKPDKTPVIRKVTLPYADVYEPVLHILAYAEMMANLSRYDGIKFGYRAQSYRGVDSLYVNTRDALGIEEKFAAVMGAYVLSQENYERYYEKAMKIRGMIRDSLRFDEYDVVELPPGSPLAVLCGLPSLTFGGVELAAGVKNEGMLIAAWEALQ